MSQTVHMSLDIRGALRWNKRQLAQLGKCITDDRTGRTLSAAAAREWLLDRLAEGKQVLPMGECDAFDYVTGCRGHEAVKP